MSRAWWDAPAGAAVLEGGKPVLMPGGREGALAALQERIAGFVPEWRDLGEEDSGVALVRIFGVQLAAVMARVERLPDKLFREFLSTAGITLSAPRSARAQVAFTPSSRNIAPIEVPAGFRLASPRGDGEKGEVIWETDAALTVANCALEEILLFNGSTSLPVDPGTPFEVLGARPKIGAALYLGFSGTGDLSGILSLAFAAHTAGPAAPVAAGAGVVPVRDHARLIWEVLTGRGFEPLDVESDDTAGFTRPGTIRLAIARGWQTARPAQTGAGEERYWLRLRFASGTLGSARTIAAITPHAVGVTARETFREKFPVARSDEAGKFVKLAHAPVLAGSVVLEIDEGAAAAGGLFDLPGEAANTGEGTFRRWHEVATLAGASPEARVFTLDPASGTIRFGDNRHGAAPPAGIRNIAVRSYATTSGAAGNVAAGEISKMVANLAGIEGVENLAAASGGVDAEAVELAEARGPGEIKARGRSVTLSDSELLAQEANGADILRAYALSGVDPAFPGAQIPGTIGLFVIPRRPAGDPADAPPSADSETLKALAEYLAAEIGPLGARVAAGNPRYHQVAIEGTVLIAAGADAGGVASALGAALDSWLSPETPDPTRGWWSVGATLRHVDLSHIVLAAHEAILAAPYLAFRVDGIRHPACADVPLSRFGLPWPARHRLLAEFGEDAQ